MRASRLRPVGLVAVALAAPLALAPPAAARLAPQLGRAAAVAAEAAALDPRRAEIVATARRYAELRWRASEEHAHHGDDGTGTWVDTPDAAFDPDGWRPGAENVGMPYAWGGFTSLEAFERGLAEGLWAGNVPRSEHAGASRRALGLDCSGFVARAWGLPIKQSTRSLGALCYELGSYDELLPGDVANAFDRHVVLVLGFADAARTRVRVLEAARLRVEESVYPVAALARGGFVPMRYKPLDPRWVPMELGDRTLVRSPADAPTTFEPGGGAAAAFDASAPAYADARPGDWARHHMLAYGPAGVRATGFVARRDDETVELQRALVVGEQGEGGELLSGATVDAAQPLADALLALADFPEPLRGMEVRASAAEAGTAAVGDARLSARRLTLRWEGAQLVRGALYPATVEATVVQGDGLPLLGVVEGRFVLVVDRGRDGAEDVRTLESVVVLEACGRG